METVQPIEKKSSGCRDILKKEVHWGISISSSRKKTLSHFLYYSWQSGVGEFGGAGSVLLQRSRHECMRNSTHVLGVVTRGCREQLKLL